MINQLRKKITEQDKCFQEKEQDCKNAMSQAIFMIQKAKDQEEVINQLRQESRDDKEKIKHLEKEKVLQYKKCQEQIKVHHLLCRTLKWPWNT